MIVTDKEIVKALECCCSEEVQCRNCTLPQNVKDSLECGTVIAKECLDLINRTKEKEKHYRQKVQNQRETINALQDKITRQQAEVERLQGEVDMYEEERKYHFEMSRQRIAKAIKEFAKKFKRKSVVWRIDNFDMGYQITDDEFDNLVKEMVGERNG